MEKHEFHIPNISCKHCTSAITDELKELDGVQEVDANVANKTVLVKWDAPADKNQIIRKLKEINYPPDQ